MRRSSICLLLTLLCFSGAYGEQKVSLGLETGYFSPQSEDFREFYGGGIQLGAELSVDVWKGITFWTGARYFSKTAQLSFTQEDIILRLLPIYLGMGYQFLSESRWRPYIGGGISLNIFRESAPLETLKQTKTGYWGQAGITVRITERIFLEGKCVYNYCRMEFPEAKVDISGISGILSIKFLMKS